MFRLQAYLENTQNYNSDWSTDFSWNEAAEKFQNDLSESLSDNENENIRIDHKPLDVSLAPTGEYIAWSDDSNQVAFLSIETRSKEFDFNPFNEETVFIAFSHGKQDKQINQTETMWKYLITVSKSFEIKLWHTNAWTCMHAIKINDVADNYRKYHFDTNSDTLQIMSKKNSLLYYFTINETITFEEDEVKHSSHFDNVSLFKLPIAVKNCSTPQDKISCLTGHVLNDRNLTKYTITLPETDKIDIQQSLDDPFKAISSAQSSSVPELINSKSPTPPDSPGNQNAIFDLLGLKPNLTKPLSKRKGSGLADIESDLPPNSISKQQVQRSTSTAVESDESSVQPVDQSMVNHELSQDIMQLLSTPQTTLASPKAPSNNLLSEFFGKTFSPKPSQSPANSSVDPAIQTATKSSDFVQQERIEPATSDITEVTALPEPTAKPITNDIHLIFGLNLRQQIESDELTYISKQGEAIALEEQLQIINGSSEKIQLATQLSYRKDILEKTRSIILYVEESNLSADKNYFLDPTIQNLKMIADTIDANFIMASGSYNKYNETMLEACIQQYDAEHFKILEFESVLHDVLNIKNRQTETSLENDGVMEMSTKMNGFDASDDNSSSTDEELAEIISSDKNRQRRAEKELSVTRPETSSSPIFTKENTTKNQQSIYQSDLMSCLQKLNHKIDTLDAKIKGDFQIISVNGVHASIHVLKGLI